MRTALVLVVAPIVAGAVAYLVLKYGVAYFGRKLSAWRSRRAMRAGLRRIQREHDQEGVRELARRAGRQILERTPDHPEEIARLEYERLTNYGHF